MDSAETNPAAEAQAPAVTAANSTAAAKPFDFRHPVFLSSAEWRKLRIELDEFVESIGALLSTYLRLEFGLQIGRLQTVSFNEFTGTVPSPTQLALFKLEPMRGISILEIRPLIGSAIVDRLLGGPGQPINPLRNLSEMEVALLDQVVQVLLNEWTKQWGKVQDLRAEILGHENNPKFLQSSSGDTIMLVATLEARMGECVDQIQLAFPYSTLEPLVKKLAQSAAPSAAAAAQASGAPAMKWNRTLDDVPITVSAQWPAMKITTRALLALKPGEVLELNPELSEKIEIRLGSMTKFKGRLGTRDNKWAIQITEISKTS